MKLIHDKTRLLVLSPHADDEILGCGGLICKVKEAGGEVHVGLFTYGDRIGEESKRKNEYNAVMTHLRTNSSTVFFHDQYHLKLDTLPCFDLIQCIEKQLTEISPDICALPFASFNQDHKIVYEAAIAALRSCVNMVRYVVVYEYPQAGWNLYDPPFVPNLYLDISDQIEKKIFCFQMYESQQKSQEYALSSSGIKALAQYRGKEISTNYAEAYILKRGILS